MSERFGVADPDVYYPWLDAQGAMLDGDAPLSVDTDEEARRAEAEFPGVAYLTSAELDVYFRIKGAGRSHADALAAARGPQRDGPMGSQTHPHRP